MKYQVGQRVTGIINNITDLGIFMSLPQRSSGLIHRSDFGDNWEHERRRYQIGEQLRVVVVNFHKGKIGLSKMRVNDPDLIDHTNQFSDTKNENFLSTLTKTMQDGQKEIKKLQQDLNDYAN